MTDRATIRSAARGRIAPLDADVLLAFVLGVSREELYAHPSVTLTVDESARFAEVVDRRASGVPVAYLRGVKEFYGLELVVDSRVLIPRPETETVVDAVRIALRARPGAVIADIGTGSGAIAISLAVNEPGARLIATDISSDALAVARANGERHGVSGRIEFREGDLLAPLRERIDIVAANLPYLREDATLNWVGERTSLFYEPRLAVIAGSDGLALVRRALDDLPRVLAPGGAAFFEMDPAQVPEMLELAGTIGRARVIEDLAGAARVVAVERIDH